MIIMFYKQHTKTRKLKVVVLIIKLVSHLPHVRCIHVRCDVTRTNSSALVWTNPGTQRDVLISINTVPFPCTRKAKLTCRWQWLDCISEPYFGQRLIGLPVHGTTSLWHRLTKVASWNAITIVLKWNKMSCLLFLATTLALPKKWIVTNGRKTRRNR